jgi:hypothetical protein
LNICSLLCRLMSVDSSADEKKSHYSSGNPTNPRDL